MMRSQISRLNAIKMTRSSFTMLLLLSAYSLSGLAATLQVGPEHKLKTPSAAAIKAKDNDVIEIDAGLYAGDTTVWHQDNLTIRAVNGRAHLKAGPTLAEDKAIWVIKGNNTTIENIEFSGARVEDRNGAGIRQEGAGLTVRHCYFHHNENGILTNHSPTSEITVEHSEFFANGHGDGYSHNLYIGEIKRFTLKFSYSHGADIGHQVKSRAKENLILYNRLMDEVSGTSSYLLDLPNGGLSLVMGNLLQQSPQTDNSTMMAFGVEGSLHDNSRLYLASNTFVNDRHAGVFVKIAGSIKNSIVANNLFAGRGKIIGETTSINNLKTQQPGFVAASEFDYRLGRKSPAINAGNDLGQFGPFKLTPQFQYKHPMQAEPRSIKQQLDIGAYEYNE